MKLALPLREAGTHHGPEFGPEFGLPICGEVIDLSSYNLVASNKPSPIGINETTQFSDSLFKDFPDSLSATVFGSRWAGSETFEPPKK
jgi:hypothetical protein